MKRIILAALMAIAPASALAQDDEPKFYWSDDGEWHIFSQPDRCYLVGGSNHETLGELSLFVTYVAQQKRVRLTMSSQITTSLDDAGTVRADVLFFNNRGIPVDDSWGEEEISYNRTPNGEWHFYIDAYEQNALDLLDDLSNSGVVTFTKNGEDFAGNELKGSAVAIGHLKKCAFTVAGLNINDPFAK